MTNPKKQTILSALDELIFEGFQDELLLVSLNFQNLGYHSVRNIRRYVENSPSCDGYIDTLFLRNRVYPIEGTTYYLSLYAKKDTLQRFDILKPEDRHLVFKYDINEATSYDDEDEEEIDYDKNSCYRINFLKERFGIDMNTSGNSSREEKMSQFYKPIGLCVRRFEEHKQSIEKISDAIEKQGRIIDKIECECINRRRQQKKGFWERIKRWLKGDIQYKK